MSRRGQFVVIGAALLVIAYLALQPVIPAWVLLGLAGADAFSAAVLVVASARRPRIGALVERAAVGVIIAFFAFVFGVVALDTDMGRVIFSTEIARFLVRGAAITLFAVPLLWSFWFLIGRLGADGSGGTGYAELMRELAIWSRHYDGITEPELASSDRISDADVHVLMAYRRMVK